MLPKQLKYGTKVESAMARSYRTNILPQNGSSGYNLGDTIIINIPTRNNLVMNTADSYLKFNFQITSAAAASYARLDACGIHSIFQRLRVFHGSNLLQDIDSYGLLVKMLFDTQVSRDSLLDKYNVTSGTRFGLVNDNANPDDTTGVKHVNSGESILSNIASGTSSTAQTYCINLVSLLGTLGTSNYLPLFACTSAPIRLELQLASSMNNVLVSTPTAPTLVPLSNVEYIGNFIELSDQAMSIIESSLDGQPLQYVVPDYRNYQYSFAIANNTNTQVNMPIPAKFSSLKSLFVMMRPNYQTVTYFPCSTCKIGISDYQFRVGSQLMPTKAVSTTTEMFCELMKAVGSMSDLNYSPSLNKAIYNTDTNTAVTTNILINQTSSGGFYIGIDLENYAAAPKDTIFTGYNSNTDDIFAVINFSGTAGNVPSCRFDAFALFDEVIVFENGTAYVKF